LRTGSWSSIIYTVKWTERDKIIALRQTILFGDVPEAELKGLLQGTTVVVLESGQVLFAAGDPCGGLYIVLEGRTRAVRHGADGREQVIHEDIPFSSFPEVAVFDDGPYPSTVLAVEPSLLLFIPRQRVQEFCFRNPQVAMSALRVLAGRLRKTTGLVEDLSLKNVSQRLAEFLLDRYEEASSGDQLELRYSNQEIADTIGTVREVVSRAFAKLQRKGWIAKTGRIIRFLNRQAMEEHAFRETD